MPDIDYREELTDRGCLFLDTGTQFIGNSGRHLTGYATIDPLMPDVQFLDQLTKDMAKPFTEDGIEAVLSAAVGAIPLGYLIAKHLIDMNGAPVNAVWADKKEPRGQELKRISFEDAIANKRVLLVDGVINSMFTAIELARVAQDAYSELIGMTGIVENQGVNAAKIGVPRFESLVSINYEIWEAEDCVVSGPCSEGKPIVIDSSLGHGSDYQADNPNYKGGYVTLM